MARKKGLTAIIVEIRSLRERIPPRRTYEPLVAWLPMWDDNDHGKPGTSDVPGRVLELLRH